MAGILDDLFEDLVKEPERKEANPDDKEEKPEGNPGVSEHEEDTPQEDDDKAEPAKSGLFPASKEWEEFKEQHKSGA